MTGDLDLTGNKLRLTQNAGEEVRQKIEITLNTNKGEWIYNVAFGIPYFKNQYNPVQLLGKSTPGLIDSLIEEAIMNIDGVSSIQSYRSVTDKKERRTTITFKVLMTSGEIVDGQSTLQI